MYDILIKDSTVIDGTGNPGYKADIGVKDRKITKISRTGIHEHADTVIEAAGLMISPGFVDMHTHADVSVFTNPLGKSLLMQGVTLVVTGNCGSSPAPLNAEMKRNWKARGRGFEPAWDTFPEYMDKVDDAEFTVNVATQIGHNAIRSYVMGQFADRRCNQQELEEMSTILRDALKAGAIGFSSGLMYTPGHWSDTRELVELCKIVAEYGAVYMSHMRGEANEVLQSVHEIVKVAEESGVSAHIGHHRAECRINWGLIKYTLEMLTDANRRGLNVTCDFFPYEACGVGGGIPLPRWASPLYMPKEKAFAMLRDPETRERIKEEVRMGTQLGPDRRSYEPIDSTDDVVITIFPDEPELQGKTITEIAEIKGIDDPYEYYLDTVTLDKPVGILSFDVWSKDIERLVKSPIAMIGTDSGFVDDLSKPMRHPRNNGSFAKILGKYVREEKLISWEDAVRKLSTVAHAKLGIQDRGLIRPGFYADLVLFDPLTVADTADYSGVARYPEGIKYVLVNGEVAVENGAHTGAKPGVLIRNSVA